MRPPRLLPLFTCLGLAAASTAPLPAAERVALVIGIDAYPADGALGRLNNCVNDARLVANSLRDVGFTVVAAENPNLSTLDEKLTEFEGKVQKGGTALVYFAGHGIEFEGQNYLLAANAKLQGRSRLSDEALKAETFATAMLVAGAKTSLLLLDCCRDAPRDSQWLTRGQKRAGLAEINVEGDIIIGFAASPGKPALEPDEAGKNSPYAQAIAKWIPGGLKHSDFFDAVRKEVHALTGGQQRTWESGSFLEPFYFTEIRKANPVTPAKTDPAPPPMTRPAVPPTPAAFPAAATGVTLRGATKDNPFVNSLGMKFVPAVKYQDGKLVHFCIWETRVQDYAAYAAKNTGVDGEWKDYEFKGQKQGPDHPVVNVSHDDAKAFAAWLTQTERAAGRIGLSDEYRLPTDVEWSYAVGIGDKEDDKATPEEKNDQLGAIYPWGTAWPPASGTGNFCGAEAKAAFEFTPIDGYRDQHAFTAPVGSYAANEKGIFDLSGNVWEWCEDWYDPTKKESRVVRGGSWSINAELYLRSSFRAYVRPSGRLDLFGFRLVVVVGGVGG